MKTAAPFALLGLLVLPLPACGSSDASWAALAAASQKACLDDILRQHDGRSFDTSFVTGRVSGIGGESQDAYYGLTIAWKTGGMNETWLCLYDKQGKTAQAREIETVVAKEGQ